MYSYILAILFILRITKRSYQFAPGLVLLAFPQKDKIISFDLLLDISAKMSQMGFEPMM